MSKEGDIPAIEIGGTHVSAALVDTRTGRLIPGSFRRQPLDAGAPAEEIVGRIVFCAAGVRARAEAKWGVALPGPFDYEQGIGRFEAVGKFEALDGLDLRSRLLDGLGAAAQIEFINDADAFLLGEWTSGAAAGHRRAAAVTLGTGVGSAFLADGVIVEHGLDVPPEGRLDLLKVDGRPLEETISRRALLSRYATSSGLTVAPSIDVFELAQLAIGGDHGAHSVFDESLAALGQVLAPWLDRFRATVLVVGGSIARSWELVHGPLRRGLGQGRPGLVSRIQLSPAARPDEAALIGAAVHLLRQTA